MAQAQQAQEVVVTGIRAAIESSIATKRNADSIVEAVSAEDIGKLRRLATPEVVSHFAEELTDNAGRGVVNTVSDVKLVKGDLLRVFVMGKGAGWGQAVPESLRNGNWVYASYLADARRKGPEDLTTCRACHLPLANKDFVQKNPAAAMTAASRAHFERGADKSVMVLSPVGLSGPNLGAYETAPLTICV